MKGRGQAVPAQSCGPARSPISDWDTLSLKLQSTHQFLHVKSHCTPPSLCPKHLCLEIRVCLLPPTAVSSHPHVQVLTISHGPTQVSHPSQRPHLFPQLVGTPSVNLVDVVTTFGVHAGPIHPAPSISEDFLHGYWWVVVLCMTLPSWPQLTGPTKGI